MNETVKIWEECVTIPTYEVGKPDKNPMFLEKRVYQGSSGKVYPFPVIDKIYDEKIDKKYNVVFLENEYLKIMIMPELGGRVQRALDKTNNYDFVYYNRVIKPALVGLTGPWISGGIEFNWPQHHRPSTFSPVDFYSIEENADGSKSLKVHETDKMYGTSMTATFTLYPGKAYLEIKGQLYNPTMLPQTFLWWANPAVAVNNDTQSIFPPDVYAVMDHGKRDVSEFPIAKGVYYKHDYSPGTDISRYKNIPVPTSYMAFHSDYDFVGGYDWGIGAGVLHIADHHISPGKKQWTWGNGDFGKAWDRNLTDEDGPYIELMTGIFTDNQPDFTWLKPLEEKTFTQYFMPYKEVGCVKNASTEIVLGLDAENARVYATSEYKDVVIVLSDGDKILFSETTDISPQKIFSRKTPPHSKKLTLSVYNSDGRLMLSCSQNEEGAREIPQPAQPAAEPEDIATNEELWLTGLHIEQYRHATYDPDPYYIEGLKRDPNDSRINIAYGMLLLRRGLFAESEPYFRKAISRLTWKNPNPYTGEAHLNLGLSLFLQDRKDEAYDAFYKATWSDAEQRAAFYYLAAIDCARGHFNKALSHIENALARNTRNIKAHALKDILLGKKRNDSPASLDDARMYMEFGCYDEARKILGNLGGESPLIGYYSAYCAAKTGDAESAKSHLKSAAACSPLYCFPNMLEDIAVLEFAIEQNPEDAKAPYYLANLFYDKKQYETAINLWEKSAELDPQFPTVWRNLSLAYYNKRKEPLKAREALERAFSLDETDARVFFELDQLYKKIDISPEKRISNYERHKTLFVGRDDLCVEYATLLNALGRHDEALRFISERKFHPWEGGEGKITKQYALALRELAKCSINDGNCENAVELLQKALVFPENLGEGKLEGAKDNDIYYHLGCAYRALGREALAREAFEKALLGEDEPADAMFYNDQPADMILYKGLAFRELGRESDAQKCFGSLVRFNEAHINDVVKIDYFAVSLPDLQLFDKF